MELSVAELKKNLVTPHHANCTRIDKALKECEQKARTLYGDVVVDKVTQLFVEYFDKGKDAAIAVVGKDRISGDLIGVIQFSMYSTIHNINEMVKDIVPHEYAHVLCMANGWDYGHGETWKTVCISLGGSGDTHHTLPVIDGRLRNLYEARTDDGNSYWLTGKQVRMARATGVIVRDNNTGREYTLTRNNITGKIKKL